MLCYACRFTNGLGRLAAWHFSGGPVVPPSRWAATSNVVPAQRLIPLKSRERETKSQRRGEGRRKWKRRGSSGTLSSRGMDIRGMDNWILEQGPTDFLVTPLLLGPVFPLSLGRFEEPVRPCADSRPPNTKPNTNPETLTQLYLTVSSTLFVLRLSLYFQIKT